MFVHAGTQLHEFTGLPRRLFHEGTYTEAYRYFGAHRVAGGNGVATRFAVWAPRARRVRLLGDFNRWGEDDGWDLAPQEQGVWSIVIPGFEPGQRYKYEIETSGGERIQKADPYAFASEVPPRSASVVFDLGGYVWGDAEWLERRRVPYRGPMNIYEVHLGSWCRGADRRILSYRELADRLVPYLLDMGYTHLELLPVAEHPFDGSWGYQVTGFFAATSRYGTPHDLMYLIDRCHQAGIGVIVDWVPAHFCKDGHGLGRFDGEPLYEPAEPERAENHWDTLYFDFERPEVQSFLLSNALFWFREFHVDGLRVDAVSNMLFSGGSENPVAVSFIRRLNEAVFAEFPQALMIAEESSTWPMVTWPTSLGGLGFNFKWKMGWMNDVLRYMALPHEMRHASHHLLTFSLTYAFTENFILPFSHDEVVHGKRSLLDKMPGDYWQKFANLRLLLAYQIAHPGKKLLFMGGEFGQFIEWKCDDSLDWHLLTYPMHAATHRFVRELNHLYKRSPALWHCDTSWDGFEWIEPNNGEQSVLVFARKTAKTAPVEKEDQPVLDERIVVVCNFTPAYYPEYRIGAPWPGRYREVMNTDRIEYGGSGQVNEGVLLAEGQNCHGREQSLRLRLPPLAAVFLRWEAYADAMRDGGENGEVLVNG